MIDRRQMLAGGVMLAAMPTASHASLPIPAGNRLGFDVLRGGSKLGTHVLTFLPSGNDLIVHVEVEIAYRLMGITLYRYAHHATETWSGDQVVALRTTTDDNGTSYALTAKREADGLVVTSDKMPRYVAPADAMPATHWNRRELDGPWINTQDGRIIRPKIAVGAIETIPAVDGTSRGRRYSLSGDVKLDMWYDDRLGWTGLSFVKGGAPVRYERQPGPAVTT